MLRWARRRFNASRFAPGRRARLVSGRLQAATPQQSRRGGARRWEARGAERRGGCAQACRSTQRSRACVAQAQRASGPTLTLPQSAGRHLHGLLRHRAAVAAQPHHLLLPARARTPVRRRRRGRRPAAARTGCPLPPSDASPPPVLARPRPAFPAYGRARARQSRAGRVGRAGGAQVPQRVSQGGRGAAPAGCCGPPGWPSPRTCCSAAWTAPRSGACSPPSGPARRRPRQHPRRPGQPRGAPGAGKTVGALAGRRGTHADRAAGRDPRPRAFFLSL
jgi:hypothetical protein